MSSLHLMTKFRGVTCCNYRLTCLRHRNKPLQNSKLSVYFFLGDVVAGVCVVVTDDVKLFIQRPRQILLAAMEGQLVNSYFACFPIFSEMSKYEKPLMRRKPTNKRHTYISRYSTREPQHSSPPPHSLVILSMEAWSLQKGIPPPPA